MTPTKMERQNGVTQEFSTDFQGVGVPKADPKKFGISISKSSRGWNDQKVA